MELCSFNLEVVVDMCTERVNNLLLDAADTCIPAFTVRKKLFLHGLPKIFTINQEEKKGSSIRRP